jgi:hypothetical protein
LRAQYCDALRVVTRDLSGWNWPAEGIITRALWTRNKWRLYLNLSLVEQSILSNFGTFWLGAIEGAYSDAVQMINRLGRLEKLLELNAPAVIVENERRMIRERQERVDLGWYEPIDPWEGLPPITADGRVKGIVSHRAGEQGGLRDSMRGGAYYQGYITRAMVAIACSAWSMPRCTPCGPPCRSVPSSLPRSISATTSRASLIPYSC